jgi:YD repeat-containing protein
MTEWRNRPLDLYVVLTSYSYGSTESRVCGGQTTRVTRTYNNFHLQTAETRQQNDCSRSVETEYYAVVGKPFCQQPAQFQLPKKRTVTWKDPDVQEKPRKEVTETSFDKWGNPTSKTEPDGTVTAWTYYPAGGSGDDCPPEPNGFTRLLKDVTRTPPHTGFNAPVYKTSYRYNAYTGTPDPRVSTAVLKSGERRRADDQLLQCEAYTYSTSGAEYGRVASLVETEYPNGSSGASYTVTHAFGFSVQQEALVQTHTLTAHDQLSTTRSQRRSRFTERLWSTTDPQGNVATRTYDSLGRKLTHTLSPDTSYQAVETHVHAMGGSAPFVVTTTDTLGNQIRESCDGAGRLIQRERKNVDGDGSWYTVQTLSYDAQGRSGRRCSRRPDTGLTPSIGSVGVYYNALAETTIGLYKTECVRAGFPGVRRSPIRTLAALEEITSAWVHWYNTRRLMHRFGAFHRPKQKLLTTLQSTPPPRRHHTQTKCGNKPGVAQSCMYCLLCLCVITGSGWVQLKRRSKSSSPNERFFCRFLLRCVYSSLNSLFRPRFEVASKRSVFGLTTRGTSLKGVRFSIMS